MPKGYLLELGPAEVRVQSILRGVDGPRRVFLDFPAFFTVDFSPPVLPPEEPDGLPETFPFEWRLLDPETGSEVSFPYRADLGVRPRLNGHFQIEIPTAQISARLRQQLQTETRRLTLEVQLHESLRGADDYVPASRLPIELADIRIIPFPRTETVPIFTIRSFRPDLPEPRYLREEKKVKRVRWSASVWWSPAPGQPEVQEEIDSPPPYTVSEGSRTYPDFTWSHPHWTDGRYGDRSERFNRPGRYQVRCVIDFRDGTSRSLWVDFEQVDHESLPDMDIVQVEMLPGLRERPTTLAVETDPKLCENLPVYLTDSKTRVGIDFTWSVKEMTGRPSGDLFDDSGWTIFAKRPEPYYHLDPWLQQVPTKPWTRTGTYGIRCAVTMRQPGIRTPGGPPVPDRLFETTLRYLVTVVEREPILRLGYVLESKHRLNLGLYTEVVRTRAAQLATRFPGSTLAKSTEELHERLSARIKKYFITTGVGVPAGAHWKNVLATPVPSVHLPVERPHVYRLRLYEGPNKADFAERVLFDAVGEEVRVALGVREERVYRRYARSLREMLEDGFIRSERGLAADYPRGEFYALDRLWTTDTGFRKFLEGADKVAQYAALIGMALMLAPEPLGTKLLGTVIVVGTGAWFALRSGANLTADWQTDTLEFDELETWYDVLNIATGIVGVTALGVQVRAGSQVLRPGNSIRFLNAPFGETLRATTLTRVIAVVNLGGDVAGLAVLSVETIVQIDSVRHRQDLTEEQKMQEILGILLLAAPQGGLMLVSTFSALPHRKFWRPSFWRSTLEEVGKTRGPWRSQVEAQGLARVNDGATFDRRRFYRLIDRLKPKLRRAFQSTQWQEMLGIYAHIDYLEATQPGRFKHFVLIGGAGRPDLLYFDTQTRRLVICELKGSAGFKEFTSENLLKKRGRGPKVQKALEASADYLELPVRTGSKRTVAQDTLEVLAGRRKGAMRYSDADDVKVIHHELKKVVDQGIDPASFDRHYAFAAPDPRMPVAEIQGLRNAVQGAEVFFHQTDASLVISPELFQEHLKAGYYQILRVTNVMLAHQAFADLPDSENQRVHLETLREQIVQGLASEFEGAADFPTPAEAILETVGELDRSLQSGLLEDLLTALYTAEMEESEPP